MDTCQLGNSSPTPAPRSLRNIKRVLAKSICAPREILYTRNDAAAVISIDEVSTAPESSQPSLWDAYNNCLQTHPLLTKCCTSCSGFLLGDILAQLLTDGMHIDPVRCLVLASYGFLIDAPAGNAFYDWLDANLFPNSSKSIKAVAAKIAVDQLVYAPIFTCLLYIWLTAGSGNVDGIPAVLQEKVVQTLMANFAVWPLAHGLNFYFVPTEQRILYNNFVGVCWTTWLSCMAH